MSHANLSCENQSRTYSGLVRAVLELRAPTAPTAARSDRPQVQK